MTSFRNLPIKQKLVAITMLISGVSLLLACAVLAGYEQSAFRRSMARDFAILADMFDDNVAPGLTFNDPVSIEQTLQTLSANPHIVAACVYDKQGGVVGTYRRPGFGSAAGFTFPSSQPTSQRFGPDRLDTFQDITLAGEVIGVFYVRADLGELGERAWRYIVIVGLLLAGCLLVALLLASWLQRFVAQPIEELAQTVAAVSAEKNYSARARGQGDDELGRLVVGFNGMLAQIEARDTALLNARDQLEERVKERTGALQRENAERKRAEAELVNSLSMLHATLESTIDGLLVVDAKGNILVFNRTFIEMWRIPPEVLKTRDDERGRILGFEQLVEPAVFMEKVRSLRAQPEAESFDVLVLKDARIIESYSQPQRVGEVIVGRVWCFRDITARRQSEEALQRQKTELRVLFDLMPAMVWFKDTENRILRVNQRVADVAGKSVEEIEGKSSLEIYPREAEKFYADDLKVIQSGVPKLEMVESLRDSAGRERWVQTDKVPYRDKDGKVIGIVVMAQDVTERRQAEQELKEAKVAAVVREGAQRYSFLADAVPLIIWTGRPDGGLDYYNKAWFDYTGLTLAQTVDWGWGAVVHPDDLPRCIERWTRSFTTGERYEIEYRFKRGADGTYRWFLGRASARRNEAGAILQWVGTCTDIDDQKHAEDELRRAHSGLETRVAERTAELAETNEVLQRQQTELRVLFDLVPAMILFKDTENVYLRVNRRFADVAHRTVGEIEGKTSHDIFPREASRFNAVDAEVIRSGVPKLGLVELTRDPQGREFWLETDRVPVTGEHGRVVGIVVMAQDITERKRAEETLRLLSSAVEQTKESIVITEAELDLPGPKIIFVNSAFTKMTGYSAEEAIGKTPRILQGPRTDRAVLSLLKHNLQRGEVFAGEAVNYRKDATAYDQEWQIAPLRNEGGKVTHFVAIMRDVTERKQAEAALRQAHRELVDFSRQAGMAEVATGVLHNVGNVLNSVNVSATLVADQVRHTKSVNIGKLAALFDQHQSDLAGFLTNDERGRMIPGYLGTLAESLVAEQTTLTMEVDHLRKNIEHIKDIVAMQQAYARTSGVTETVSMPDMIEDALRINAGSLARHSIDMFRDYQVRPVITTDKHKVMQILINLVRNAKYACDESGVIDKQITVRITSDDHCVKIAVIDNGVGIPAENLTRIFNHGFTTRKTGHGFGLHSGALAARELGGSLHAQSAGPGHGAMFILELPYIPAPDHDHSTV